jgi:hypothetical protein
MTLSTAYTLEPKYDTAVLPIQDEPDVEIWRAPVRPGPGREALGKFVLDALAPSVWQVFQRTSSYRQKGEDTLSWGDPDDWIQIKWVRCLVDTLPRYFPNCLGQYGALRNVIGNARLPKLEEMYTFRNAAAVRSFLLAHLPLIGVLAEAHPYLSKYFGPNPQVALEVVSDPEADEGQDQLFAYILTSLPVDEALAKLDSLDEEWFLDQLDQVDGLFNFNLEFI